MEQATPIRTSPRRDKRAKSVTQPSVASSRGKKKNDNTPPQLVAESQSQSLLSPAKASSTAQGAPLLSVIHENEEFQITHGTYFPSDKSESNDDDDDVPDIANHMRDEALLNFFDNNKNEQEADREEMGEGLEDLNDYSSDQFSLNEHRHYFMDRTAISSQNPLAVEFVYMLEVETLTRDSGAHGLTDAKKLIHSKHILELIHQIPTNHFSEFRLREGMINVILY